jgi:hypothetical protein
MACLTLFVGWTAAGLTLKHHACFDNAIEALFMCFHIAAVDRRAVPPCAER